MKIILGTLKDKGDELAAFLEPRIGVKPEVGGGELDIEDKSLKKGSAPGTSRRTSSGSSASRRSGMITGCSSTAASSG